MPALRWLEPPAGEAVRAAVARLVGDVAAGGGAVGWLHVPGPDEVGSWLDGLLGLVARGEARLLLLEQDGTALGLGAWVRQPEAVHRRNAELRKVMTAPAARGRGVARQVVSALVADVEEAGVELLTLTARGNNHAAVGLYADLGFTLSGRFPDAIAVGDERFDEVLMHLDLRLRVPGPSRLVRHGGRREGPGAT